MEHNKLTDWMNESEKKLFAIIGKCLDEVKGNNKTYIFNVYSYIFNCNNDKVIRYI